MDFYRTTGQCTDVIGSPKWGVVIEFEHKIDSGFLWCKFFGKFFLFIDNHEFTNCFFCHKGAKTQRTTKAFLFPDWLLPPSGDWGGSRMHELFYRGEWSMKSLRRGYYSWENDAFISKEPLLHSTFYIQYFTFFPSHKDAKTQRTKKPFLFPKWLLPPSGDWGGILHFTFNILHFFLATKTLRHKEPQSLFYFQTDYFPLRGIEGANKKSPRIKSAGSFAFYFSFGFSANVLNS